MTDEQLIQLYFDRDSRAVEETQRAYGPYCAAIARRLLTDSRDAEECLNDVWLSVWHAIPPARPEHFRGWLGAIVRNRALALGRKNGRAPELVDETALELAACLPARDGPAGETEAKELAGRPPKKRMSRRVRGALIAACLCVTLVAAACAAALSGVFVGEPGSFEVGGVTLEGVKLVIDEAELFSWDDFDPEFRERAREQMEENQRRGWTEPITYYGWARASEQMGFPLADSSYLAGCVDINCEVWVVEGMVSASSARRADGVNVGLFAVISLENPMDAKLENVIAPQGNDGMTKTEACTMPDGSSAVIYSYRNNGKVYYTACFMLDGVVYMVNVGETAEYDESRVALLRSILSGFES